MKILIVTPNPTLDRILTVPKVIAGTVHRASSTKLLAGGKGINVYTASSTLALPGVEFEHIGILSGDAGLQFEKKSLVQGIKNSSYYWLSQNKDETRTCILVHNELHYNNNNNNINNDFKEKQEAPAPAAALFDTTVFNEQCPTLSMLEWQDFCSFVFEKCKSCEIVMFCGSLPLGVSAPMFSSLVNELIQNHQKIVTIDTSKTPLKDIVEHVPKQVIIKVNFSEIADALGLKEDQVIVKNNNNNNNSVKNSTTFEQVVIKKCTELVLEKGAQGIVITLGEAGCFIINSSGTCIKLKAPSVQAKSTVGCGDTFHAAYVMNCAHAISMKNKNNSKIEFNEMIKEFDNVEHAKFGIACATASAACAEQLPGHFDVRVAMELLTRVTME